MTYHLHTLYTLISAIETEKSRFSLSLNKLRRRHQRGQYYINYINDT